MAVVLHGRTALMCGLSGCIELAAHVLEWPGNQEKPGLTLALCAEHFTVTREIPSLHRLAS